MVYKTLNDKPFSDLTACKLQRSMTSTLYQTVFESKSRLAAAQAAGLSTFVSCKPAMLPVMAGQYASIDTLEFAAAQLRTRWPADELCWGAAQGGDLPKLQWLLRKGGLREGRAQIAEHACEGGNLEDMLR
jgi:hypothetical protein